MMPRPMEGSRVDMNTKAASIGCPLARAAKAMVAPEALMAQVMVDRASKARSSM